MKKIFAIAAFLMAAMSMNAQLGGVKIAPKYQKGDTLMYRTTTDMNVGGQAVGTTTEERIVVTDVTADGYVIENSILKVTPKDADNLMSRMVTMQQEALQGTVLIFTADKDGHITGIRNMEEVKTKVLASIDVMFSTLYKEHPEVADKMPKEALEQMTKQLSAAVTEEEMLKSTNFSPSPFFLNGKTIMTGGVENSTNADGLKVRNLYFLTAADGSKVKVTQTLNMTPEETKQMIIEQVKKLMPDQAEMIEQNIDAVMQSGMLKMELEQTTDYEFAPTGWLKKATTEMKQNAMGQQTTNNSVLECIYSNR